MSGPLIERMKPASHPRVRKWLLIGAVLVLFAVPFFRSYQDRERTPALDEFYWVGQTYYYHLSVQKRDWSNPDWQLIPAWENPHLGRCVIGFGLQMNGLSVTNVDWLGFYYHIIQKGWGVGRERDLRQAVMDRMQPAARDMLVKKDSFDYSFQNVVAGRAVMLLFGVISVLLVFVLVSFYTGKGVAFVAALMFSLHPAVVMGYTHLGVDIMAITFSLLTIVHFEWIHRRVWRRLARPRLGKILIGLTGGLSLGFAVGSKLNAVIVGFPGAALCLLYVLAWGKRSQQESPDRLQIMLILLFTSVVVFVISNPLHYPDPISALREEFTVPQRILEIQQQVLPGALRTVGERFFALASIVALYPAGFIVVILAFLTEMIGAWRTRELPSVIVLWWLLAVVMVTAWLPFARPLHLLPVIAPSMILLGCVTGRLMQMKSRPTTPVEEPAF